MRSPIRRDRRFYDRHFCEKCLLLSWHSGFITLGHADGTAHSSVSCRNMYCSDEKKNKMHCAALIGISRKGEHVKINDNCSHIPFLFLSSSCPNFLLALLALVCPSPTFPALFPSLYRFPLPLVLPSHFWHILASPAFRLTTKEGTKKRQMERRNQEE